MSETPRLWKKLRGVRTRLKNLAFERQFVELPDLTVADNAIDVDISVSLSIVPTKGCHFCNALHCSLLKIILLRFGNAEQGG